MSYFRALLCRTQDYLCAIPLEKVSEVMRPLPIETVAGSPSYIKGISIIRGNPLPVLDLARLLGCADSGRSNYFVSIRLPDQGIALSVDKLAGIRDLDEKILHSSSGLLKGCNPEIISSIGSLDSGLLLVLEAGRLIPKTMWDALKVQRIAGK